jgi:hypothetical protein
LDQVPFKKLARVHGYYHPSPADIFSAYAQSSFPIAAQSELKYLAIYKQICLNYTQSLGDRPRCNFSYGAVGVGSSSRHLCGPMQPPPSSASSYMEKSRFSNTN